MLTPKIIVKLGCILAIIVAFLTKTRLRIRYKNRNRTIEIDINNPAKKEKRQPRRLSNNAYLKEQPVSAKPERSFQVQYTTKAKKLKQGCEIMWLEYISYFVSLVILTIVWTIALFCLFNANLHIKSKWFEIDITTERHDE